MEAIVPDRLREDSDHDIPVGYTTVGHIGEDDIILARRLTADLLQPT